MQKYVFKPYNEVFSKLFDVAKDELKRFLPPDVEIEHVGSTDVPGLEARELLIL